MVRQTSRTPVWAPDDGIIACRASGSRIARDTKVGEFDSAIFGRQDVGALDISVDHTLVVQVHETLEDLRDIDRDEVFWELSKSFANVMQRAVLAEPRERQEEYTDERGVGCIAYSKMM